MSRILLVRLDGIGDALACVPLIAALREAGHQVGALLEPRNAQAYTAAAVAPVHVVERNPWPRHGLIPRSEAQALEEVRAAGYDIALIASEEPDAYRFALQAGIPVRAGFTNGLEKPIKSLWTRSRLTRAVVRPGSAVRESEHEAERLFRLGEGLTGGAVPSREVAVLRPVVIDRPRSRHHRVAVQLSPKFESDGLNVEAFAAAAERIAAESSVILLDAPGEAPFGREVARRSRLPLLQPSMEQWKALIDGAAVLVTPDSGAAHVAGMTGVPCVDLFAWSPHVEQDVVRWRPWAAPAQVVVVDRRDSDLPGRIAAAYGRLALAPVR